MENTTDKQAPTIDITHEQMDGGIATNAEHRETAIYSAPHLARIRQLYVTGTPITLPEQFSAEERAQMNAEREAYLAAPTPAQPSTGAASSLSLSSGAPTASTRRGSSTSASSGNAGSTAAPSNSSTSSNASTSAGTAGSTDAQ